MIRIDLHTHSNVSPDGWMSPCELVETAIAAGINKVAITDHREIDGALEAYESYPENVIVAEEVHCNEGTHIIGLFLTELVPSGQSVIETVSAIRDQSGLICAPHPFAYAWGADRHARVVLAEADVVEVFNSRAFIPGWNRKALDAAHTRRLPCAANTDAHFSWEFGRAYTELPDFSDVAEFKEALKHARPVGLRIGSPWLHVGSRMVSEVRRFAPRFGKRRG